MFFFVFAVALAGPPAAEIEQSCRSGNGAACLTAANQWQGSSEVQGHVRAREYAALGCTYGDAESCTLQASHMSFGPEKNLAESARLYHLACDRGSARGCGGWASALERGEGVARDVSAAWPLYKKSCDAGDRFACYDLGRLHTSGSAPIPSDRAAAFEYYRRSCDMGFDDACLRAGDNRKSAGDSATARTWFTKGCQKGSSLACDRIKELDGKPVYYEY